VAAHLPGQRATGDQKTLTEPEQRAARKALQRELFITLLHLALKYIDQPEMLGVYMQPHLAGGPPLGWA
jgi:hypothetical protein